jgi:hypothetical protein
MTGTLSLLFAAILFSSAAEAQQSVVGTWKLVSYDTTTPEGVKTYPLGEDAVGQIIYLPNGRMSVHLMRRDRSKFASGDPWRGTLEEERAALRGYFAYAGKYTIDTVKGIVTHHIEMCSAPNYVGTDVVRTFTMQGNRVVLKTPPRFFAGQNSTSTLVWERID